MSTEVILIPAFPFVAVGGAVLLVGGAAVLAAGGGAVLAGRAALGVKRLLDRELERARAEREHERAALAAYLRAQEKATAAQRAQALERAAAREVLGRIEALTSERPVQRRAESVVGRGFLAEERSHAEGRERALAVLAEIEQTLARLPRQLREDSQAPFGRLAELIRAHRKSLAAGSSKTADIAALRATVERTIAAHFERHDRAEAALARLCCEAEALLDQALECRALAAHGDDRAEADGLVQRLRIAIKTERPRAGALDAIRRRLDTVKARIEARLQTEALRTWLGGRIGEHLDSLGYVPVEPLGPAAAGATASGSWRVPGGGVVRLALHADGRLAAKLSAEPGDGVDLKRAEEKWCGDVRELLRCLAADGVPYHLSFERRLPDISLVALETAEELCGEDEEQAPAPAIAQELGRRRS